MPSPPWSSDMLKQAGANRVNVFGISLLPLKSLLIGDENLTVFSTYGTSIMCLENLRL